MEKKDVSVFFDLDNTIFDFSKAETAALTRALTEFGINVTDELIRQYKINNKLCWEALERGEMTRHEVLVTRFQMLFDKYGISADAEAAQDRYENLLMFGHDLLPGAEEVLKALFIDYRLFIVSNGNIEVQNARLSASGISKYFENIFISEIIGVEKPSKLFFDRCFAQISGLNIERAIIIGDSLTSDIQGGINAGMKTCLFDPLGALSDSSMPDYRVSSLVEIPALLSIIF